MQNCRAVVFDAFGTLFDTESPVHALDACYPGCGLELNRRWQEKQLQQAWAFTLTGRYVDYERIGAQALAASCRQLGLDPSLAERNYLSTVSRTLPPYPDVLDTLNTLHHMGFALAILSNGTFWQLQSLVRHGGIVVPVELLSADFVGKHKPHPSTYALVPERLRVLYGEVMFVSAHEWDVLGASSYGFFTTWLNRRGAASEGFGVTPFLLIETLQDLVSQLQSSHTISPRT